MSAVSGVRVLVAGATGPLGAAATRELLGAGARVAVHYRTNVGAAQALVAAGAVTALRADLLAPGGAEQVVSTATRVLQGLDAVVNCAWPAGGSARLAVTEAADLDRGLDGLRAHHLLCRAAVAAMRARGGSVVFLGGALATRLYPGLGVYSVAKAAATTYSLALALEEGRYGIRVNVIAPGRVDVGEADLAGSDAAFAALDRVGALRRALPCLPRPQDVAREVVHLVSPAASALTGQVVALTGGEPV